MLSATLLLSGILLIAHILKLLLIADFQASFKNLAITTFVHNYNTRHLISFFINIFLTSLLFVNSLRSSFILILFLIHFILFANDLREMTNDSYMLDVVSTVRSLRKIKIEGITKLLIIAFTFVIVLITYILSV